MALQVWLPLNGNLNNQGLYNVPTISTANTSTVANGKIGNCVKVAINKGLGYEPDYNTQSISMFGWFKFNQAEINAAVSGLTYNDRAVYPTGNLIGNDSYGGIGLIWIGNNYYPSSAFTEMKVFAALRTQTISNITSQIVVPFDTWIHLGLTWSPETHKLSFYKNGELHSSTTYAYFNDGIMNRQIQLDASLIYGGNGPGASIPFCANDIRIYDHCLSPMEVKEISKALILHYKLDDITYGYTDMALKTFNIYNNYGVPASITALSDKYNGYTVYRESMTPTSAYLSNFQGVLHSHGVYNGYGTYVFNANTKYVYWVYYRPQTNKSDIRVGGTASNIGGWTEIPPVEMGNGWYRVGQYRDGSVTVDKTDAVFTSFYSPSAEADVPIVVDWGPSFLISGTTEIPPNNDFNNSTVYDCSGLNNNGTIVGTIEFSSNTPRYSNSIYITDGRSNYITSNIIAPKDECTMSIWVKGNVSGYDSYHIPFCISSSKYEMSIDSTGRYRQGFVINGTRVVDNMSTNVTDNNWHNIVATFDGTYIKRYVDGILVNTKEAVGTLDGGLQQVRIGNYGGSTYGNKNLYSSDIRLYATALSDDDIKDFYNVSAYICNNGTLVSYQFIENDIMPQIYKNGDTVSECFVEKNNYIYLSAGTYVNTNLYYGSADTCEAVTVMRYEAGGSGRDLMGYSPTAGGYWGVTSGGTWERPTKVTSADITALNTVYFNFSSVNDKGYYMVGALNNTYSVRNKYIYSVKLYKNGVLERYMIPFKNGSQYGLYDIITKEFYACNNNNAQLSSEPISEARLFETHFETNQIIEK